MAYPTPAHQQPQPSPYPPPPGPSQYPAYAYPLQQGQAPAGHYGAFPPGTQQPAPPLASSSSFSQLPNGWPTQQQPQYAVDLRQTYPAYQQQQQQHAQYAPVQQPQQHAHSVVPGGPTAHQRQAAYPPYAPQQAHQIPPAQHQPQYQQQPYHPQGQGWPQQYPPNGYQQQLPPAGYAASPTPAGNGAPPPPLPPPGSYYASQPAPAPTHSHHQQLPNVRPSSYGGPPPPGQPTVPHPGYAPQQPRPPGQATTHRYSSSNPPLSSFASPSPPPSSISSPTPPPSGSAANGAPHQRTHSRAGSAPRYPTQKPSELSPLPSSASSSVSSRSSAAGLMAPSTSMNVHRSSPSLPGVPTPPRANSLPQPPVSSTRPAIPTSSYHGITPSSSTDLQRSGSPVTAASPTLASPQPSPLKGGAGGRPLPSPLANGVVPPRSSPSPLPSMRPASPLAAALPSPGFAPSSGASAGPTPPPSSPVVPAANGRPLPRPPGGVLPSKSLDRGSSPATSAPGGQWASLVGAPPVAGPGGIARAATLPSTLPPLPRPISLLGGEQAATPAEPIVEVKAPDAPPVAQSPAPPAILVPDVVVPAVIEPEVSTQPPIISGPPAIVTDSADDLANQLASTAISPPVAALPQTPQKKAASPSVPVVIPTFTFVDDDDAPPSPAHSASSPGPKISFSSPKASSASSSSSADPPPPLAPHQHAPPAEQPALDAKSSTAARETSRLRNGALANGGIGVGGEIRCASCQEQILGRLVSGAGGFWHPKCFKCTTCNLLLEHVSSFEHEGKLYCHLDYHELFTTRCYTCKTPIVDERFFTINDPSLGTPRYYHELHFFCSECGDPFLDPHRSSSAGTEKLARASSDADADDVDALTANINLWRGHPYCDGCHVRLHAPKCKGCRKPIGGEMLEALGGKWHAECLKCESCEGPFEGLRIFEHEGMGLCEGCFSLLLKADL